MRLYWEITTKCNNSCNYCFGNFITRVKDLGIKTRLNNLIRAIKTLNASELIITGGEPCMAESLIPNIKILKELFSKLKIRIITNGDYSFDIPRESIENKLIQGITFTDHDTINRSARLRFIKSYEANSSINVIIPINRKRIDNIGEILDEYQNVGCNKFSLNIIHYNIDNDQSIYYAKKDEVQKLLSINNNTITITNKDSLVHQLKYIKPIRSKNNLCKAGEDFIYIDSAGNIKGCPYHKKEIANYELLLNMNEETCSKLILQNITSFYYEKKECLIHPGCVCINGSVLI